MSMSLTTFFRASFIYFVGWTRQAGRNLNWNREAKYRLNGSKQKVLYRKKYFAIVFGESCKLNRPLESLFDLGHTCFLLFPVFFFLPLSVCVLSVCLCHLRLSTWPQSMTHWKCIVMTKVHTNTSAQMQLLRKTRWLPISICCGYKLKSVPLKSVTNSVHTALLIAYFEDNTEFYIISFTNTPIFFISLPFLVSLLSSARRMARHDEIRILNLNTSVRPDT